MALPETKPWMPALARALTVEFSRLQLKNPHFSQRGFAQRLGLSSSALSELLRGKRNVSRKAAARLLAAIGQPPLEEAAPTLRPAAIPYDQFALISEWYHLALLSLLETKGARRDVGWIAERLGIPPAQAQSAVTRLLRLGLLKRHGQNSFSLAQGDTASPDEIPAEAIKRHHAEGFELAKRSLFEDPIDARDFTSMTLAVPLARLPEAKRRIRKFRDELTLFLEAGAEKEEVYRLCLQLFPLSRGRKKGP